MITFLAATTCLLCAIAALRAVRRLRAGDISARRSALVAAASGVVAFVLVGWSLPDGPLLGKVVGHLAMPAGLLWLLLYALALVHVLRRDWWAAASLAAAFVAYTAVGNGWVGATLLERLEAPYVAIDPLSEAPFDAVLVLGGGTRIGPDGRSQISRSGDRVVLGARMYHAGLTPVLVASGRATPGAAMQENGALTTLDLWTSLGIPEGAIVTLEEPHNTRMEIAAYATLIEREGWTRVGLITSAWHLRRAMALAEAAGLELVPLPADFRGLPGWDGLDSLIPQGAAFELGTRAAWEWLGAATGR